MPDKRRGAAGSFGAPLNDLLPTLGGDPRRGHEYTVEVHRKPAQAEADHSPGQCRIFMLNQRLYERAAR